MVLKGLTKIAFSSPGIIGAGAGVLSGYQSARQAARSTSGHLSDHGSKTRNEETASHIAKLTGIAGALGGIALAYKHKNKVTNLARKHISPHPDVGQIVDGAVPFLGGTLGGMAAGHATGALMSLRGRKKKDKK